jgi:Fe(3+) dicitrate transport protein
MRFSRHPASPSALQPAWLLAALSLLVAAPLSAGEADSTLQAPDQSETSDAEEISEASEDYLVFEELLVVGSGESRREVPGSAHVITEQELERQGFQDVHRVLRQVPGISVQEEDGFGLRPNIGIRGTGVERSSKITMLEDGVLIAPAPYAAPSAYYAPTAGRMTGFEIRKGSAAIRQGPYTNGGSINYLSRSVPPALEAGFDASRGSDGLERLQAHAGGGSGRTGWLIEAYDMSHGGFKDLDGGGDTGFTLSDYLGKLRFATRPDSPVRQTLELKLGRTRQRGNETYLGLTATDFARTPYRRYAASAGDNIESDHDQLQLSYEVRPRGAFAFTVTTYRNDFFRNWAKLEGVSGTGVAAVLADPEGHPEELAILRGEASSAPGALAVRNNRRNYYSSGLQAVLGVELTNRSISHELDFGLRVHEDEEDRFQEEDLYSMRAGRRVFEASGAPGSHANRIASAEATALFVQDTIRLGRWTLTPGVRVESIDLMRRDFGKNDPGRSGASLEVRENSLTEVIPGFGASYALDDARQLFVGAHRGFSPPSPSSTEEVDAEESLNFELGFRFDRGSTSAEAIVFYSDYDNLLGTDTTSGGGSGTGDQFNGGAATVYGLETAYRARLLGGGPLSMPLGVTYTYSAGEFDTSFQSGFADWAPGVRAGDALPYLPEHQINATLSLAAPKWEMHMDGNYSASMRTRAGRGAIAPDERIENRLLFDLRAEVTLFDRYNLFAQVLNLTDESYVAARRPAGLRPGMPRTLVLGVRGTFGAQP